MGNANPGIQSQHMAAQGKSRAPPCPHYFVGNCRTFANLFGPSRGGVFRVFGKRGVQKAGSSMKKTIASVSLSSVDVFGSDGQRPRGKRCFWGPLEDRSCGSHAGGSYGQTVHYALSRLEPIKRHPAGTEGFWGGTKFTCERQSTRTAELD